MSPETKARITRFLNDEGTSQAVYSVLLDTFLKDKNTDVHMLAAGRLAVDYLQRGWKELEKCREVRRSETGQTNPGI